MLIEHARLLDWAIVLIDLIGYLDRGPTRRNAASSEIVRPGTRLTIGIEKRKIPRHFGTGPAKFAQKRGNEFYWCPAGSTYHQLLDFLGSRVK